jgi:hypothetical protein
MVIVGRIAGNLANVRGREETVNATVPKTQAEPVEAVGSKTPVTRSACLNRHGGGSA